MPTLTWGVCVSLLLCVPSVRRPLPTLIMAGIYLADFPPAHTAVSGQLSATSVKSPSQSPLQGLLSHRVSSLLSKVQGCVIVCMQHGGQEGGAAVGAVERGEREGGRRWGPVPASWSPSLGLIPAVADTGARCSPCQTRASAESRDAVSDAHT